MSPQLFLGGNVSGERNIACSSRDCVGTGCPFLRSRREQKNKKRRAVERKASPRLSSANVGSVCVVSGRRRHEAQGYVYSRRRACEPCRRRRRRSRGSRGLPNPAGLQRALTFTCARGRLGPEIGRSPSAPSLRESFLKRCTCCVDLEAAEAVSFCSFQQRVRPVVLCVVRGSLDFLILVFLGFVGET